MCENVFKQLKSLLTDAPLLVFPVLFLDFLALTHKGNEFIWSPECENVFKQLKSLLTDAPLLVFPGVHSGNRYVWFRIRCCVSPGTGWRC